MIGTVLNAAGIILGGMVGFTIADRLTPKRQLALRGLLGVATVFVGLRTTILSFEGGFWAIAKQLLVLLLALSLGRLLGRLLRLQKLSNRLGQYAKEALAKTYETPAQRLNAGFRTGALLFCAAPLAGLGAVHDGLDGNWQPLAVKAVMDGLATMAFVTTFGWGVTLAAIPVVALQGTLTLFAQWVAPFLQSHDLLNSVNAAGGMLVFCVALIILEIRKVEVAGYLPSLAVAPLLTWAFR